MHHALQIQEILLNLFDHCHGPHGMRETADLPALARTCRAFKEPALDVLWKWLFDPSPLARCLPEASHHSEISTPQRSRKRYSFSRSLTQVEWAILRSYSRRIRTMYDGSRTLDWESVKAFVNPPTTEPLFPNLRYLYCNCATPIMHLLHMPFPSLILLHVESVPEENLHVFQGSVESFSKFSPNISRLTVKLSQPDITFSKSFSNYICRWRNLETVNCPEVALDVGALVHLSRMPTLTKVTFMLSDTLPNQVIPSDSSLFSSNLHALTLYSKFLDQISRLLSRTRLPAITDFGANIGSCPSKQDLSFFLAGVQTSGIDHTVEMFRLTQSVYLGIAHRDVLDLEDLRPCMMFSNLRHITISIEWKVGLTDGNLLALASAWPHLEYLEMNSRWGWQTPGITPDGLARLLQICQSLNFVALALDTRGYIEIPAGESQEIIASRVQLLLCVDVLDSIIEAESVPAITAFFAGIGAFPHFSVCPWTGFLLPIDERNVPLPAKLYLDRWHDVHGQVIAALKQYSIFGEPRPLL
ncbi:hypothetical protein OG21DRAFT_1447173 [Imleria badia]|nr:hypothetical protein OG21DRAFT_1447173 [Imleria badia]